MVYVDKTAYVDYDKTLLREFSIMSKVRKLTLRNTRVGLRLAAGADSDSRDFLSSGCRGLQFATTAYSMSQSLFLCRRSLSLHLLLCTSLSLPLWPRPSPHREGVRHSETNEAEAGKDSQSADMRSPARRRIESC